MKPVQDFLFEPSTDIGGCVLPLLGKPGSGKTIALTQIGIHSLEQEHTVVWRGTKQAQWINFVANNEKVVIWNHSSIDNFKSYISNIEIGKKPRYVDLDEKENIEIKEFEDPKELVKNLEDQAVNVVNVPGVNEKKGSFKKNIYFFRKTWIDILHALVDRKGGLITVLYDELGDFAPCNQQVKGKNFELIAEELPNLLAQMRKEFIWFYGASHGTHDIHYNLWKIKNNGLIYMSRANVKRNVTPETAQTDVNNLSRGEFIFDGYESKFELPKEPNFSIKWMPNTKKRYIRLEWTANTPNLIKEKNIKKEVANTLYDEFGFTQEEIGEVLGMAQSNISRLLSA